MESASFASLRFKFVCIAYCVRCSSLHLSFIVVVIVVAAAAFAAEAAGAPLQNTRCGNGGLLSAV